MRSTFSVLFYLKRKDVRKDGTVPVMGRITIDGGKPAQFSCKMTVDPALWNTETGRMTGAEYRCTGSEQDARRHPCKNQQPLP